MLGQSLFLLTKYLILSDMIPTMFLLVHFGDRGVSSFPDNISEYNEVKSDSLFPTIYFILRSKA